MNAERRVLHIFSAAHPQTEEIDAILSELSVDVGYAADCYLGMAHLVRQGSQNYDAVLVHLGDLVRQDDEFFRLTSHRFRSTPIYVYGTGSADVDATWAIQAGARGRIDATDLREMFADISPATTTAGSSAPATAKVGLTDLLVGRIVGPLQTESTGASEIPPRSDVASFDASEIAAQREDARRTPRNPEISKDSTAKPREQNRLNSSLLSEEELRALLGDEQQFEPDQGSKLEAEQS